MFLAVDRKHTGLGLSPIAPANARLLIIRPMTARLSTPSLLDAMLAAAVRDRQTTTPDGRRVIRLTDGVRIKPLTTHTDARGSLMELFDARSSDDLDPIVFAYTFTIRPGVVKGWNLHREHEDRYVLLSGVMELVLFDPRPESPTHGEVCRVVLSDQHRCQVNVPRNVWHADHNIGSTDVVVVNFPTQAYDHANPDKYRLPLDTDLIPHSFGDAIGW
jgi:dTDP-4-dehydrorhamnose 3,5-epimerase